MLRNEYIGKNALGMNHNGRPSTSFASIHTHTGYYIKKPNMVQSLNDGFQDISVRGVDNTDNEETSESVKILSWIRDT